MEQVTAVIFDWDETLAQTRPVVVRVIEEVLSKYKLGDWETVKKKRDPMKSFKNNFSNYFGEYAEEAYTCYVDLYRNACHEAKLSDGAEEITAFLQQKNIRQFIVSNKETELLKKEVTNLLPEINFVNIIGANDCKRNKPYPDQVFKALENTEVNIDNDNVLFVGDSMQDVECAYASGCKAIVVGDSDLISQSYIGSKKDLTVLASFYDLQEYFNK